MNKKPYNQIEAQMKAAAQGWEPAFDEPAWEQMEQMLENEDERKRPFAWWLLLVPILAGIGIAGYFGWYKNVSGNNITALANTKPVSAAEKNTPANTGKHEPPANEKNNVAVVADKNTGITKSYQNQQSVATSVNTAQQYSDDPADDFSAGRQRRSVAGKSNIRITASNETAAATVTVEKVMALEDKSNEPSSLLKNEHAPVADSTIVQQQTLLTPEKNSKKSAAGAAKKSSVKNDENKQSPFYFSLYGGMEGNGVKFPGINKISPRAGFTTGYYLNKKLSIRAGFFVGSKKYIAGKNDYKAKPGTYWSMVDITKVDASCRVYEIPLSLRYDLKQGPAFTSFAGIGLSSFLMDKEDYAYDYIYYNEEHYGSASYTGNRHWFSVLRIYGGLEKKISNNFSLGLQPGLSIPLAGVGEGQIKLFSSELLFSLKYHPSKKTRGNQ